MIFDKKKITVTYTVEQCASCHKEIKRKFKEGDYLFSDTVKCTSCDGVLIIAKIFGETIEQ
jgi:hypothetical protein